MNIQRLRALIKLSLLMTKLKKKRSPVVIEVRKSKLVEQQSSVRTIRSITKVYNRNGVTLADVVTSQK